MVHELVVPDHFPGSNIYGHQAVGEEVVSRTMAAVDVIRRGFNVQVHVPEIFIDREWSPDAGISCGLVRIVQPRFRTWFAFTRNGVEDPFLFSGANIERHDVAL